MTIRLVVVSARLPPDGRASSLAPMNARLDLILNEARAALSTSDQDRLADLIAAFVASRAELPDTDAELAELKRRHDEPFDPAPDHEVREFFARHRG